MQLRAGVPRDDFDGPSRHFLVGFRLQWHHIEEGFGSHLEFCGGRVLAVPTHASYLLTVETTAKSKQVSLNHFERRCHFKRVVVIF